MSVQKATDSSAKMKDVIKAKEEGVKENGKLTYSRLHRNERVVVFVCNVRQKEGFVFRHAASNQEQGVN